MRKFRFRLQTKLDISVGQEKLAMEQLAAKIAERNNIIQRLNNKKDKLEVLQDSVKRLSFQHTLIVKDYLPILRTCIYELQLELAAAEDRVEVARNILIECKKETKTLTRLREKEWHNYLHELNLEEQKEIDEIAINNHFRKN